MIETIDVKRVGLIVGWMVFAPACGAVLNQDAALAVLPYRNLDRGRFVVDVSVDDQGPFAFLLDTGATTSVAFKELPDRLKHPPTPDGTTILHGAVASGEYPVFRFHRLTVGTEVWTNPRLVVLPRRSEASRVIDGILGIDFLRRFVVGFSPRERVVRLYRPDTVKARAYQGWSSVPLEPAPAWPGGPSLYLLDVHIAGREITAVFDLGSDTNLLNWAAAKRLRARPSRSGRSGRRSDYAGALERAKRMARLVVPEIRTGDVRWRNETFLVADLAIYATLRRKDEPTAILGAALFHQRDFIIDFVQRRLLVKGSMEEIDAAPDQPPPKPTGSAEVEPGGA